MSPTRSRLGLLVAGLLAVPALAAARPDAPSDDQLKQAALKLNEASSLETALQAADKLLQPKDDAKRLVKLAAKMQKEADKQPPFKFNAAYALAKVAQIVKEYDAAEGLYDSCAESAKAVRSGTKLLEVQTGLTDLYFDQKKWAEADKAASAAREVAIELAKEGKLANDGQFLLIYEKLIQVKGLLGDTDKALAVADEASKEVFPKIAAYFRQPRAVVLAEAGRPADAVKELEKFLEEADTLAKVFKEQVVENLKRSAKYRMTGYQVDAGDVDGAVKTLRDLLEDNPKSATFHNDLGFVLADHDRELAEAEKLCRKALELDAAARKTLLDEGKIDAAAAKEENAAYLDSLGWVLFKQGKFKDALPYLEKASKDEDEGRHLEIWDHLADCLLKLDQKDKAIATWEKALTFEDVSKRDIERRKKVSAKLKAAKGK
jgi:predicted Zn-dependent protease